MFAVHFVTGNKAKADTLQHIFEGVDIEIIPTDLEIREVQENAIRDVAIQKAKTAFEKLQKPCVVHDGGFCVNSLNDFPNAYSKFVLETIGIEGILRLIEGKERDCSFVDVIAYMDETLNEPKLFEASVKGMLGTEPKGELGIFNFSDYHKIFIPEDSGKTLAEMTDEEHIERKKSRKWCDSELRDWLIRHVEHEDE